ncbi:MAG: maltose alpha-D-glucosyltransferase [Gammaproteobacteria bacterium]|nr:maltose alpha-D-glucosyltransferase [Gammaproteobacteria bacterium]
MSQQSSSLDDDSLWYKDAVIYQLHVKAFYDSNGDGVGDFQGLIERLDYVRDLGVNCIWILPFYPSPLRDDGYDIADYRNVHPHYGTMADFREFVREAHARGLRVITEMVLNHTSDQHPWFQSARRATPGSSRRNFYVWSDDDKKYSGTRIIFRDTETSNWAWDPVARQYYWHRFFSHQPDLNFDNPQVVRAVTAVMRFWLDAGVDGMRLDAIPYLCEREGTNNENLPETHEMLKQLRSQLDARHKDRMFLAEANQWPEDVRSYFGDGDECHMAFHFPLMPRIYMAVAQEDRHPIGEILEQTPDIPDNCQWAIFLRNHDELTLEMVTDYERDYMYQVYANDPRMRLNLGIRRRLAPLVDNDVERIKLLNNLLLSLIGSPVLYYGDELGMGDNIFLGDRNGVRTPMQWSPDRNAGFSRADPARLYLPPIMDPIYGYEAVNVEAQTRDPYSLLNWMKRLIAVRKAHKAFGRGTLRFLRPGNRKILAYLREYNGESILCVSNLSRAAQPVELDLSAYKARVPVEMLGRTTFPPIGELPYLLTLPGYGFYWFLLSADAQVPRWHQEMLPPLELPWLVMFAGWRSLYPDLVGKTDRIQRPMAEKLRRALERDILPRFIVGQRWYSEKGKSLERAELIASAEWGEATYSALIALVRTVTTDSQGSYFLPLSIVWGEITDEHVRPLLPRALARVRRGPRVGVLVDALAHDDFCRALVRAMGLRQELAFDQGRMRFAATAVFERLVGDVAALPVRSLGLEQSNSSVILADRLILKVYRRFEEGVNPDLEIGRFLTEVSPFAHIPPLAGYLEFRSANGSHTTLALLQGYIANQGDGWVYTIGFLERHLEAQRSQQGEDKGLQQQAYNTLYMTLVRTLGQRIGELHQALSRAHGDPAFEPERVEPAEYEGWWRRVQTDVASTLAKLKQRRDGLGAVTQSLVDRLLEREAELIAGIGVPPPIEVLKMRYHGDLHLGQVLLVKNDFVITDFEGEPARPLAERRAKHSALRDVAGVLRSFNYAAYHALRRLTAERPDDYAVLEPLARDWEATVRERLLDGYREAATGAAALPSEPAHAQALIQLFIVEKMLYELRYELDNRPAWVDIPVRGLLAFLGDRAPTISPELHSV